MDDELRDSPGGRDAGYPGVPRWVKVAGLIAIVVIVLIAFILITGIGGPHGPFRHLPGGGADAPTATATGGETPIN